MPVLLHRLEASIATVFNVHDECQMAEVRHSIVIKYIIDARSIFMIEAISGKLLMLTFAKIFLLSSTEETE